MLVVTPVSQYATSYRFATAMQGSWHNFVNVTAPTARLEGLLLDGRPVDRSRFAPIGDGSWSCGMIEVGYGARVIAGTARFGIHTYGFGYDKNVYDAYGSACGHMVDRTDNKEAPRARHLPESDMNTPIVAEREEECAYIRSPVRNAESHFLEEPR